MNGLIGKKIGMTQIFDDKGNVKPVTVLQVGPCPIVQLKAKEKDGYCAVQLGFGSKRSKVPSVITKPLLARYQKVGLQPCRILKEIRLEGNASDIEWEYEKKESKNKKKIINKKWIKSMVVNGVKFEVGKEITLDKVFSDGDMVNVTGISKGRGFAGVVKRHHFSGGDETHGSMSHRVPGSIGSSTTPSRVWKGKRMPGRMGGEQVTIKNLNLVKLISDKNLMMVEGAVPGCKNGYVIVKKSKARKKQVVRVTSSKKRSHAPAAKTPKKK